MSRPSSALRILFPVIEVTALRLMGLPPTVADSAPFRGGHELVFLLGSLAVIATLGPSWRLATGLFLTLYAVQYVAAPIFQIYYPGDTPGVFFCLLVIRLCMRPRTVVAGLCLAVVASLNRETIVFALLYVALLDERRRVGSIGVALAAIGLVRVALSRWLIGVTLSMSTLWVGNTLRASMNLVLIRTWPVRILGALLYAVTTYLLVPMAAWWRAPSRATVALAGTLAAFWGFVLVGGTWGEVRLFVEPLAIVTAHVARGRQGAR